MEKKMKRNIIVILAMILAAAVMLPTTASAETKKSIAVTMKGVKISKDKATLTLKKTSQLTVKYNDKTVTSKATYKSSNKKVASVSKKGKITAKKKGTCTITIKYKGKSKKLKLTVRSAANSTSVSYSISGKVKVTGKGDLSHPLELTLSPISSILDMDLPNDKWTTTDSNHRFTFDKITFKKAGTYQFAIREPVQTALMYVCNCGATFECDGTGYGNKEFDDHSIAHILAKEPSNYWWDDVELTYIHVDERYWTATIVVTETNGKLAVSEVSYASSDGKIKNASTLEFTTVIDKKPKKK